MTTEFIIQLGAVFTIISGIIVTVLKYNGERFKLRVDDDTVKRKEVSELLQKLYDDTQAELKEARKNHREEVDTLRKEHREEMLARDSYNAEEIRKRDVIIGELISRLPKETRDVVESKMKELNLEIKKEDNTQ